MTATGIDAVLREAGAGATLGDEAEQAALFSEIAEQERAALDQPHRPWSGRGRKPGSRNIRTRQVVEYIGRVGRDPLLALHSVVQMTPEEVRRQFGFDDADKAAEFWRKCAGELAPYLHSRMPQAVTVSSDAPLAPIFLNFGQVSATRISAEKIEQIQAVINQPVEQVAWPSGRTEGISD